MEYTIMTGILVITTIIIVITGVANWIISNKLKGLQDDYNELEKWCKSLNKELGDEILGVREELSIKTWVCIDLETGSKKLDSLSYMFLIVSSPKKPNVRNSNTPPRPANIASPIFPVSLYLSKPSLMPLKSDPMIAIGKNILLKT